MKRLPGFCVPWQAFSPEGCVNGVRVLWLRTCTALTLLLCLLVFVLPSLGQNSAAALPWSGQAICQLNLQQDGYTHQETQTWTITGAAPRADSNVPMYDAAWSFSGKGAAQRNRGPQTITAAWKRAGSPVNTTLTILVRASDSRLLIKSSHTQLRAAGATIGLRSTVTAGAQPSQTVISSDVYEWPFPVIEVAGDSVDVTGTGTIVVTGGMLPLQMASTNGTATCEWHFARGGSAPARVMKTPDAAVLNPGLPAVEVPSPKSVSLKLNACPYPAGNCSGAGGYTFRVRAHNGGGGGPYSSSTGNVRPLVSYVADNVAGIWTASKCVQCHTGPNTTLDLSGPAAESYSRVGLYSARNPANRDRLLACPTGGSCSTPQNSVHPGGQGFSSSSKEYFLLLQWIQDGFRNWSWDRKTWVNRGKGLAYGQSSATRHEMRQRNPLDVLCKPV